MHEFIDAKQTEIEAIVKQQGAKLYEVSYVREAGNNILRVVVDTETGIDLDTCVNISDALSLLLDEENTIDDEYFLDVCSPGAEKPLLDIEDVKAAVGNYIAFEFLVPTNGLDEIQGDLEAVNDEILQVKYNQKGRFKTINVPYNEIKSIRLAVKF